MRPATPLHSSLRPAHGAAIALLLALLALPSGARAQYGFSTGSTGAYGPINVTSGTTALAVPEDGIFHATTVNISSGATLRFTRNALNTPVYILATGDVTIAGTINVAGASGIGDAGGLGGPGGFDGGWRQYLGNPPGAGHGPGGGGTGGNAGYGSAGSGTNAGVSYGTQLLIPLVGGSGGGGTTSYTGGGGGGAILIASPNRIILNGTISALGGGGSGGAGSGGAVRLVAPVVEGTGAIEARNGGYSTSGGGRVRVDSVLRDSFSVSINAAPSSVTYGTYLVVFPTTIPRLDLISVAGTSIPEGTTGPVAVTLPTGTPTSQQITLQARDFTGMVPYEIVLIPENGTRTSYTGTIDMASGNPATVNVSATFPTNTRVWVEAWTR